MNCPSFLHQCIYFTFILEGKFFWMQKSWLTVLFICLFSALKVYQPTAPGFHCFNPFDVHLYPFLVFEIFSFSVFVSEPCDYEVFRCMYAIWDSLSFLDVWIDVFHQVQEGFNHYFSPPLSLPSPLSLSLSTCCYIRCCLTSLLGSVPFFFNHFFLSVLQISRLLFVCLQRN